MLAAKIPEKEAPAGPPLQHMTPEMEMLMRIFDRLGEVIQATVAAAGGKPPKLAPLPRPVTALERLRTQQLLTKHYSIADRMLGRASGASAARARHAAAPTRPRPGRPPSAGVPLGRAGDPAS